jgi:hypothetical protein
MARSRCQITVVFLISCAAAHGDFITERWGNGATCQLKGTLEVKSSVLLFDLSALKSGKKVHRAVFMPSVDRRNDYTQRIEFCPVLPDGKLGEPLKLRPPLYTSFDATEAVRKWAADPGSNLGLDARSAPRFKPDESILEISNEAKAAEPIPNVTDLKAVSQYGQTFITFKEIEDLIGEDRAVFGEFEKKVLDSEAKRKLTYRVYRHARPITVQTLGEAELIDEVRAVLSIYNLQMIKIVEHANRERGDYPSPLIEGGNRVRSDRVTHLRVSDGGEPLPHGAGLSVVNQLQPGKFHYAVTAVVDGREAVQKLDAGCSTAEPVEHKPQPIAPVLQFSRPATRHEEKGTTNEYAMWIREPYSAFPRTIWVQDFVPAKLAEPKVPLEITTPFYGEVVVTTSRHFVQGSIQVGAPNFADPMWQGMHECVGTWKSYDDGVVANYEQRVAFSLIEWAKHHHPVDPDRVSIWGQYALWAVRHPDVFAVVMADPYGNYAEMIEAQKRAWQWGTGPLGGKNWLGIPQWVYMHHSKWIAENPATEMPYLYHWPAGGSHVGDMGFLSVPALLHALASSKRAFSGTWGHSLSMGPPPTIALAHRIRRNQAVPAFRNCSIDDCPGDGRWGADGDRDGWMNGFLMWDPDTIADEPDEFAVTLWLHDKAPEDICTVALTPRRTQRLKPKPGDKFKWTHASPDDGKELQSGTAAADASGLVTVEKLTLTTKRSKLRLWRE